MKIFINYALTNAFRVAKSRDKISAIKHMIHHGMEPIKATRFIEAMSKDLADTWQAEKAFCMHGVIFYRKLASLRTSLFLRYNTEHIFYL